jgi:hypothetical protein
MRFTLGKKCERAEKLIYLSCVEEVVEKIKTPLPSFIWYRPDSTALEVLQCDETPPQLPKSA